MVVVVVVTVVAREWSGCTKRTRVHIDQLMNPSRHHFHNCVLCLNHFAQIISGWNPLPCNLAPLVVADEMDAFSELAPRGNVCLLAAMAAM